MQTSSYDTATVGTLLLGLGDDGHGEFTSLVANAIVNDRAAAAAFVESLPRTSRRRVFIIDWLRGPGGAAVVTDAYTHTPTALAQFKRFVRHAARSGFTPAAAVTPADRRSPIGRYAELADIEAAYADALSTKG